MSDPIFLIKNKLNIDVANDILGIISSYLNFTQLDINAVHNVISYIADDVDSYFDTDASTFNDNSNKSDIIVCLDLIKCLAVKISDNIIIEKIQELQELILGNNLDHKTFQLIWTHEFGNGYYSTNLEHEWFNWSKRQVDYYKKLPYDWSLC